MRLTERYRPAQLSAIVGQDAAVAQLDVFCADPGGRALLATGPSGSGKTSAVLAVLRQIGVLDGENLAAVKNGTNLSVMFRKGSQLGVDEANELDRWFRYAGFAPFKAAIIDEAQNITARGRESMLTVLETLPEDGLVLLTTTGLSGEQFDPNSPFGSRCQIVEFGVPDHEAVMELLIRIATTELGERLDGLLALPLDAIARTAAGNVRKAVDLLEQHLKAFGV